jgi:hypothetical protein
MLLLAATVLLALTLSACVRPVPGSEEPPTSTPAVLDPLLPAATLPGGGVATALPVGASPTPQPAPVEASPTPQPPAPEPTQPPAPPPTAAPTGEQIHVVQAGENLFRIALRYGFTVEELAAYNGIPNPNVISVGQQIRIPAR